jgi:hypothetical protein
MRRGYQIRPRGLKDTKTLCCDFITSIMDYQMVVLGNVVEISQALAMHHVGAVTGAKVIERPTSDGSVWIVEFIFSHPLPESLSNLLEVSRGGPKIFKGVQAALNDLKTIGMANATVQFTAADSFRANRFEWLYEWIRGLHQQGFDEERILSAFTTNPATRLNADDHAAVKLGRIIIRHALGRSDGKDLEAYLPPVEVLNVRYLRLTDEGHLCQATCANSEEDFVFLVGSDVPEKKLKSLLSDRKAAVCKYVLVAAHRLHPQAYTDPECRLPASGPYTLPVASFRLTSSDFGYLHQ